MNFFLADVQSGLGPFLGIYLLTKPGWNAASIGAVMTIGGVAGLVVQTPVGALIDRTRHKRALVIDAAVGVSVGAFIVTITPSFLVVTTAQLVIGVVGVIFPPAIAAIAFGALLLFFFAVPETCPVTLVPTAAPPVVDPTRARPSGHGIAVMMSPGGHARWDGSPRDYGLVLYRRTRSVRGRQRLIDVPNTSAALGRGKGVVGSAVTRVPAALAGGLFEVGDALVGGRELVFEADDAGGGGQGHVLIKECADSSGPREVGPAVAALPTCGTPRAQQPSGIQTA